MRAEWQLPRLAQVIILDKNSIIKEVTMLLSVLLLLLPRQGRPALPQRGGAAAHLHLL
jgi:hypothetical protein